MHCSASRGHSGAGRALLRGSGQTRDHRVGWSGKTAVWGTSAPDGGAEACEARGNSGWGGAVQFEEQKDAWRGHGWTGGHQGQVDKQGQVVADFLGQSQEFGLFPIVKSPNGYLQRTVK